MMRNDKKPRALLIFFFILMTGCRGVTSREPPIHLNPNMDQQTRIDPQEPHDFFEDGRGMRPLVPGTVARGTLKEDDHLFKGKMGEKFATHLPMKLTSDVLKRGQQRFNIYCAVCHDSAGTGNGIVIKRGFVPPPSFHDPRIRQMPVGQIFDVISNGARTMSSYAKQVSAEDRWAIAAYVRALQISQNASVRQVPADEAASRRWVKPRE